MRDDRVVRRRPVPAEGQGGRLASSGLGRLRLGRRRQPGAPAGPRADGALARLPPAHRAAPCSRARAKRRARRGARGLSGRPGADRARAAAIRRRPLQPRRGQHRHLVCGKRVGPRAPRRARVDLLLLRARPAAAHRGGGSDAADPPAAQPDAHAPRREHGAVRQVRAGLDAAGARRAKRQLERPPRDGDRARRRHRGRAPGPEGAALAIGDPRDRRGRAGDAADGQRRCLPQPRERHPHSELRVESNALPVRVAASSGIVLRRGREFANLAVGNALTYGLAGELPFSWGGQRLAALATLAGEVELQQSGAVERPMELLAAVRWLLPANLMFTFGGGPGLTNGYGTPRYRVFAGIGFDPAQAVRRSRPRPPPLVQDFPRPALALVPPPVEPEAPLPVPVAVAEAEPAPPVPPMVLPLPVAAVVLAHAPTPGLQRAVRNGLLALLAQVQFAHDAATILPISLPLLDQVVAVLRDTPEIRKVRIEGHTDGRGKPAYNRRLSQRRAQSAPRASGRRDSARTGRSCRTTPARIARRTGAWSSSCSTGPSRTPRSPDPGGRAPARALQRLVSKEARAYRSPPFPKGRAP